MRCPLSFVAKFPRAVIVPQLKGRLLGSVWAKQTVKGPKLNVQHVKMLFQKFLLIWG